MVEELVTMDAVLRALASGVRRDMLGRLAEQDLTVGELAEPLTMTLAAASKHIKVLERVGLVRQSVEGRRRICRLEAGPLAPVSGWIRHYEQFWTDRLDAMEAHFRSGSGVTGPSPTVTPRPAEQELP